MAINSSEVHEESMENSTAAGQTNSSRSEWVPLSSVGEFGASSNMNLTSISQATLQIIGRQVDCTVYRYSDPTDNGSADYYVANNAEFL